MGDTFIDALISRGADLARAREAFPDIEAWTENRCGPMAFEFMKYESARLTKEMANHVEVGDGGELRFGVRFGEVIVFTKRTAALRGDNASAILSRLAGHPALLSALVAASSQQTWEAYQRREAQIASDESERVSHPVRRSNAR